MNFQMFKLDLEKAEEPEFKLPASGGSLKKQERSRKTSALLIIPKPLCGSHKLWKILKETGIPDHLTYLLRNLYAGQVTTENQTWYNRLVPNQEKSISRLYIVTLILLMCRVHYMKCWTERSTSWNQDCWVKYQ